MKLEIKNHKNIMDMSHNQTNNIPLFKQIPKFQIVLHCSMCYE